MSDFTDREDRQLVQLALAYSRKSRNIIWGQLAQRMKSTRKSKEVLRQRLKTLKRTYGRNLESFPAWFFKDVATESHPQRLRTSLKKNQLFVPPKRRRLNGIVSGQPTLTRFRLETSTKPTKTSRNEKSPRSRKRAFHINNEPLASLLLLASVASLAR